jgi:rhodanese-related sulfurtransferase
VQQARGDQIAALEDQPIMLYCGTGGRSALAAETMALLGYRNVTSMAGGIVAWAAAKLPVATP